MAMPVEIARVLRESTAKRCDFLSRGLARHGKWGMADLMALCAVVLRA